jgi:hypothetical protein
MLTVPEGENNRHIGFAALVNVGGLQREARRDSDKTQILGGSNANRRLSPSLPSDVPP